jgi:hypothetical protein
MPNGSVVIMMYPNLSDECGGWSLEPLPITLIISGWSVLLTYFTVSPASQAQNARLPSTSTTHQSFIID